MEVDIGGMLNNYEFYFKKVLQFLKSPSILKKFLLINLVIFIIIGLFTIFLFKRNSTEFNKKTSL